MDGETEKLQAIKHVRKGFLKVKGLCKKKILTDTDNSAVITYQRERRGTEEGTGGINMVMERDLTQVDKYTIQYTDDIL